jgi:hypothetical protein
MERKTTCVDLVYFTGWLQLQRITLEKIVYFTGWLRLQKDGDRAAAVAAAAAN